MSGSQLQSIRRDSAIVSELLERAASGRLSGLRETGSSAGDLEARFRQPEPAALESFPSPRVIETGPAPRPLVDATEAIVLRFGRPTLVVQNGSFALPDSSIWRQLLTANRSNIERVIQGVGRVELLNHLEFKWVGTAWMIAPDIAVTNRHVAEVFANREGASFPFSTNLFGQQVAANVDFREEFDVEAVREVRVEQVLFVADPGFQNPDIAFLRLSSDTPLPSPLSLQTAPVSAQQAVGTVGYPAFDSRNGLDALVAAFGDIFDVKRFAPGRVSFPSPDEHWFVHDCTTTGGASGSPVFDLETGGVVGLHFSGLFEQGNFAVKASFVEDALARLQTTVVVVQPFEQPPIPIADGTNQPEHFASRDGYQADFLGRDAQIVNLPDLGGWASDVAPVSDDNAGVLKYRHFSVVVSKSRRLPLVTACNIDGNDGRTVPRIRDWFLDGRVPLEFQVGNELYRSNDFDRGHMVRRLDPVWGTRAVASEANADTFHYVNAAPQHKDLNQRDWLSLEEHILDSAKARDLKVSVFTGPVFSQDDPVHRGVQIPREFWKIAVLVNSDTDRLAAAGYLLSHDQLIDGLVEAAFVFGEFGTFQVPINLLEEKTGLSFGLGDFDPLAVQPGEEGVVAQRRIRIESIEDLVLD